MSPRTLYEDTLRFVLTLDNANRFWTRVENEEPQTIELIGYGDNKLGVHMAASHLQNEFDYAKVYHTTQPGKDGHFASIIRLGR